MKRIIYNDNIIDVIDENKSLLIDSLKDNDAEPTETNIINEAQSMIDDDANNLRETIRNFDIVNKYKILVVASLGLWYGCRAATKIFDSLECAIYPCLEDVNTIYFKKSNTTLTLDATHHDGNNNFKFYKVVKGKKYAITFKELTNI